MTAQDYSLAHFFAFSSTPITAFTTPSNHSDMRVLEFRSYPTITGVNSTVYHIVYSTYSTSEVKIFLQTHYMIFFISI
ncbi:hypothetical protein TVAG_244320 [Trichomonas vaginalis G3]|uniref:Uncharacterized protein n=1 Tax=Trichomonas vaginalis (strain ATCC PRA-98 / G3) TaxID=412133 RepID=A2ES19_TRIV3|nr:hypothetical protein TVAGG3_0689640 [Trichomonas vaginalis G3]EAY04531.1 hypothetical protein TVAG_244320 [Trichomonas vaginalis G3]KAI5508470.1 hypothetical protein TVAGG3_0689640 [Trichomonas vaginalis G3]|eukprot:XP_001316754.1 hypothetical protein [Trichomonas vaginalis G3]